MLFGMPTTIHAKSFLSIKTRGDLETARTALAHSLIRFFSGKPYFHEKKASGNFKNLIFQMKSHVWHGGMHPKMPIQIFLITFLGQPILKFYRTTMILDDITIILAKKCDFSKIFFYKFCSEMSVDFKLCHIHIKLNETLGTYYLYMWRYHPPEK
jgi:hypothetical protein